MSIKELNIFQKKAVKFKVQNNQLFRQNSKNVSICRVVNNLTKCQTILQQLPNESVGKREKVLIDRLQININGIIYI